MKLTFLFYSLSFGEFLNKKESSQFLTNRSACGDRCAKNKGKCHDYCERGGSTCGRPGMNNECHREHTLSVCDCRCVLENARCLCNDCHYNDRCAEYREKKTEDC